MVEAGLLEGCSNIAAGRLQGQGCLGWVVVQATISGKADIWEVEKSWAARILKLFR